MSKKAVLVMDMPENCLKCKWVSSQKQKYGYHFCRLSGVTFVMPPVTGRSLACPLREMPMGKVEFTGDQYMDGYSDGWNACIDAIMRRGT